tara:strand:- start:447 stop:662 length:216 start_codon:yes stop_codon:yes gene_type:complete
MESDIKIFDSNGKALNIGDVISLFIIEKAKKHELEVKDVALYFEDGAFEVASLEEDYRYCNTLEEYKPNGL